MDKNPAQRPRLRSEGKSSGADENQQVGGQQKKEEAGDASHDPQLVMPLQKLEQLKQQDSPAKLFRLMEGPASPDSGKKGKTW
jgi:Ca-activated chloride channel family protein